MFSKNAILVLALAAIMLLGVVCPCAAAEFRGFWVDAWGAGIGNQTDVNNLLGVVGTSTKGRIRDANCNAIVVQVRRNCDANYPSSMGEPYMSGLSPAGFNGLQAAINAAHDTSFGKQRIEVHAWIVTFRTTGGAVYAAHSSTPTGSLTTLDNYWPSRDTAGAEVADKAFDPGHPLAQEYTVNVAMDLVNNFDIDGIHYDYVRFTANNQGYNPTSVARYNQRYGLSGQPANVAGTHGAGDPSDQWDQWRRDQISALVRKVYAKVQASKPWVKQTGAFVTWNPSPTASTRAAFQGTRPYYDVYSDWDSWIQEGIVDAAIPMTYYDLAGSYPNDWTRWINWEKDRHGNRHMYIGPGIYMNSLANAITETLQTRTASPAGNYGDGFCEYSYRTPYVGGNWAGFAPTFTAQVTPTPDTIPVMSWKASPTKGHISGTVTIASTGAWSDGIYGTTVAITGPETRSMRTDGTGFYAFIDLTPGAYTVTASRPGYTNIVTPVNVAVGSVTGNMYVTDFAMGNLPTPIITNVQATGITATSATISWTTDVPATSQVQYGLSAAYGSWSTVDPVFVTSHSQTLTGLTPGTLYHYRVISENGNGTSLSNDYTFSTVGPPAISNVGASGITNAAATVTWTTDQSATSQVEYGLTTGYGTTTTLDSTLVTAHSVALSSLSPSTTYHYRVKSGNGNGNSTSGDYTFTTTSSAEVIVDELDAGASSTGTWTPGTYGSGYNNGYKFANTAASITATFTWTPTISTSGIYDVYCWYTSGSNRTTAANYEIHYAGGVQTVPVNQTSGGGAWVLLRSGLRFDAGTAGYVTINNYTNNLVVIADAIRWVYTGSGGDTTPPTISIGAPSGALTRGGPITYTISYADEVGVTAITLANGNVTLNRTGTANGAVNVTGSGLATRTVTISGITGDGTLGISIAAGTASDGDSNLAPAAGPSTTFAVDNTAPTVTIGAPSATLTRGSPITYTITYGGADAVTLADANVTLNKTGTANGTAAVTGSGTATRTVTVSGITGDGTLGISLAAGTASDNAGNTAPAAGPSTTFTADNTPPAINSVGVSPAMAAGGDAVHVVVDATDGTGVTSVTANGAALALSVGSTWAGDILALGPLGVHGVTIVADDAIGNSTTNASATYKTARILGTSAGSAWQSVIDTACGIYLFKFWGRVAEIDDDNFTLSDGSSVVPIRVHAPGYKTKVVAGNYASARGILNIAGSERSIESAPELIAKY